MGRNLSDAAKERQREAQKAWREENLERFAVNFRRGDLDKYRKLAQNRGVSLASIIKTLLKNELKKEYGIMEMKFLGSADKIYPSTGSMDVDVWELADGSRYCVSEWNGEKWLECWEVYPDMSTGPSFVAGPVYRWEAEGIPLEAVLAMEENSDEWDRAHEIVGLDF